MYSKKITALYLRSAREDNNAIGLQEKMLRSYAEAESIGNVEIYTDNGFGGHNLNRPAFNRLTADISAGLVDAVIVRDFSRISRNASDTLNWMNDCESKGVVTMSVTENY